MTSLELALLAEYAKVDPSGLIRPADTVSGVADPAQIGGHAGDSGATAALYDVDDDGLAGQAVDRTLGSGDSGDRTGGITANVYRRIGHVHLGEGGI